MDRFDQFGYDGLRVLFDFMEQYEEDTGEEIELDVIALCCEYSADSVDDVIDAYSVDVEPDATEEEKQQIVEDFLTESTLFCGTTDSGDVVYCTSF
jgi:hypothetical protein